MVSRLHGGDALANGLDDAGTLMTKNDGESTLGVFAGEGVCVYKCS
jgi:hypothetical protein